MQQCQKEAERVGGAKCTVEEGGGGPMPIVENIRSNLGEEKKKREPYHVVKINHSLISSNN